MRPGRALGCNPATRVGASGAAWRTWATKLPTPAMFMVEAEGLDPAIMSAASAGFRSRMRAATSDAVRSSASASMRDTP